jgi:hypothetical protein
MLIVHIIVQYIPLNPDSKPKQQKCNAAKNACQQPIDIAKE